MSAASNAPLPPERRRDPRRMVSVPARLTLIGLTVEGRLENVSARGVCFLTEDPYLRVEAANFVKIAFTLPEGGGERPVSRQVRVTRVEPTEDAGARGRRLGLEWDEPLLLDFLAG